MPAESNLGRELLEGELDWSFVFQIISAVGERQMLPMQTKRTEGVGGMYLDNLGSRKVRKTDDPNRVLANFLVFNSLAGEVLAAKTPFLSKFQADLQLTHNVGALIN